VFHFTEWANLKYKNYEHDKNIWGSVKIGKLLEENERPLHFARRSVVNVGKALSQEYITFCREI